MFNLVYDECDYCLVLYPVDELVNVELEDAELLCRKCYMRHAAQPAPASDGRKAADSEAANVSESNSNRARA